MDTGSSRVEVLLVKEDDDNREFMAKLLAAVGWGVHSVASEQEALRRFGSLGAGVHVVTDLGMPGMGRDGRWLTPRSTTPLG